MECLAHARSKFDEVLKALPPSAEDFLVTVKEGLAVCKYHKRGQIQYHFYSIIESTKENKLNPFYYLSYLFEKLPNIDINDPRL